MSDRSGDSGSPFSNLVLNAPDAICVVAKQRVLFANPAAAALVGLPEAEALLGRNVLDFASPDSRKQITALIHGIEAGNLPDSPVETQLLRADGARRDVELRASPTSYKKTKAVVVFLRDVTDRKFAQNALRSSEERYRQVVESMNEALVVYDAEARVKFVNPQFCRMFDCREADVVGKPASAIYSPETQALVARGIERRRRGLFDRYEAKLTGTSGKTVIADVSAAPLVHDGHYVGSLALITDTTERTHAQQILQELEHRYHALADGSPNFIFGFDHQDCYNAANKAVCRLLGLREEEILGRTLEEVGIPPDVAREWKEQNALTRMRRETQTRETALSIRGQPPRIMRRTTSPMLDEHGNLIGITAIANDVTDQKTIEEKHQKLLRAIEEMDEVMFTTDAAGVILYVNPAFEQIYGFTRDEAIGATPRILRSGETSPEFYEWFWKELKADRTVRTTFINRRKDGRVVRMVASVSPIHGEDGRLSGFTAVQRDVTAEQRAEEQRRQLEQQLVRAEKMHALGTLAGGIAHDFNNILSIILTQATVAEMSGSNPARIAGAIAAIKNAVKRGAGLSRQILTFARKTEVQFTNVDLNRLLSEVGSMVREMFPRNIQIDLALGANMPMIRADVDQLHQTLLNLCLNARDAMNDGGTLRLSTAAVSAAAVRTKFSDALDCGHVGIEVADTGQGMDSATLTRIFEPFYTTKEVGKGSGLGLAVVYGVVKAHGGWVDVTSELGLGSTFRLYFPASAASEAAVASDSAQRIERGTEAVLMIEDEPQIADALALQLAELGYRVIPARTAEDALAIIHEGSATVDVILTDLGIPGTSSRDLVKLLQTTAPGVPLIPMTGYIDPDLHREISAAGTQPILEKPFTIDQLLQRIRDAVYGTDRDAS